MTKMSLDNVDYAKGITQAPYERLPMGKTRSRPNEGKLRQLPGLPTRQASRWSIDHAAQGIL